MSRQHTPVLAVVAVVLLASAVVRADEELAARTVTLPEALDLLASQNPDNLGARLQVEAAQAEHLGAKLFPNPSLSLDANNFAVGHTNPAGLSTGETVGGTVRIDQPLVLWGKRDLRIAGAEAGVVTAQAEARDTLRQLRAAVKVAFYDSLHDERQLAFVLDNQKRYQEIVSLNERRFESGDISEAELRKIQLEQLKYHAQVADAQRGLVESRELLGRLLGIGSAVAASGQFAAPPAMIEGADLLAAAFANRADWAALQHEREQAASALELARRERYPDVSVGVDYTRSQFVTSGDNRNTLGFGFSVPLPLFNQNQAQIAKADIALRQADNRLVRLRLDIAQEVQTTVAAYRAAQRLQQTFEGGYLDRAKITVDAAEASYRIGAASLIELLDAERTYTSTQTDYLDTVFAARSTLTHLEKAIGKDLDGN
ncbi:MAG: TolC family protein [Deltaproteobacteria bacterium]|nr:TolC family protein [Deltaproteobacteria bacterium]MBI3388531.1 TolC family protein [Deltaproteobacteria bacterium]